MKEEIVTAALMGPKMVLNELPAFIDLSGFLEGALFERTRMIVVYAMCGSANFDSLGIMIGGRGAVVPEQRDKIAELGIKYVMAEKSAACMNRGRRGISAKLFLR